MVLSLLAVSTALSACSGGGNTSGNTSNQQPSTQTPTVYIVPNTSINAVAFIKNSDGSNITLNANKSPDGSFDVLTSIYVSSVDNNPAKAVHIDVDSSGRPSKANISDGSSVEYIYVSNNEIDLLITSANGLAKAIAKYDTTNKKMLSINTSTTNDTSRKVTHKTTIS